MFSTILLMAALVAPVASSPLNEVKITVEGIKQIVGTLQGDAKKKERNNKILALLESRVDFYEMGKRALGRHWKDINENERKEYVDVFTRYVTAFYQSRIFDSVEFINAVDIRYVKERVDGDFAEAEAEIHAGNDITHLLFKMHLVKGNWKVYDIVAENISTVSSLRAQFDRIVQKGSVKELLERLNEKIKELNK